MLMQGKDKVCEHVGAVLLQNYYVFQPQAAFRATGGTGFEEKTSRLLLWLPRVLHLGLFYFQLDPATLFFHCFGSFLTFSNKSLPLSILIFFSA